MNNAKHQNKKQTRGDIQAAQRILTVNQAFNYFGGSNPSRPTNELLEVSSTY